MLTALALRRKASPIKARTAGAPAPAPRKPAPAPTPLRRPAQTGTGTMGPPPGGAKAAGAVLPRRVTTLTKTAAQRIAAMNLVRASSASSAASGTLAAERALLAAQARSGGMPAGGGLSVRGHGSGGPGAIPAGTTDAVRRAVAGAAAPAARNVAKGRASAAVAARLAHIDALLARSKAAAGGARGYGACWPASLGDAPDGAAPAPAAVREPTPRQRTPAPSPMPGTDAEAQQQQLEEEEYEAEADWEVSEAMKGAEWAVADWDGAQDMVPGDLEAMETEIMAEEEQNAAAEAAAAEEEAAPAAAEEQMEDSESEPAPAVRPAARGPVNMEDPEVVAATLRLQTAQRGRAARARANKLRAERDALVEMADFSGGLVEAALASALQAIEAQEEE